MGLEGRLRAETPLVSGRVQTRTLGPLRGTDTFRVRYENKHNNRLSQGVDQEEEIGSPNRHALTAGAACEDSRAGRAVSRPRS